jgi:nitroreductase
MGIIEALKSRRAIRQFEDRPIEESLLHQLLEAAIYAPNDRLREPWHFYVITGEAKKRYEHIATQYLQERFPTKPNLVESSLKVLYTIPALIVITSDIVPEDEEATRDNEYATCCAAYSIWLAASELGLGCVWRTRGIGLVSDPRLHAFIGSPEHKKVIGTLCVGYPAEQPAITKRTSHQDKSTWISS